MALPRVQSPPSLSEPLVSLKSSSLQGVVSWLHSVVRGFASNLEAEKQQWESQAQELRGETRELRRRLEGLEAAAPADPERPATDESNVDLGEQLRALERRVDLWREEQLLQRDTEVHVASVPPAPTEAKDLDMVKQDLRQDFENLLEDKVQSLQLSLQQRLGDSAEELSQLLQVHSSTLGERLRICEERLTALAFGGFQASERADSKPEDEQRRPGSTGSGASNAGGASLESRIARLERNVKGLAAFASTGDAQRLDDLAMASKQAQLDARRCTERIQLVEAQMSNLETTDSQSASPELLRLIKDLEQRLNDEIEQLKVQVEAPKISSEEKMDRGILEEVHRDLLSPVGEESNRRSFALDFVEKDIQAASREHAIEVASLQTKLAALTQQQDDRALQLQQDLKKLQQQLFEAQVTATAGGSTHAPSETASVLATTLSNHEQELKNLAASVSTLQASVGRVQEDFRQVPSLPNPLGSTEVSSAAADAKSSADAVTALQRAEEAQRRVASLGAEVAELAKALQEMQKAESQATREQGTSSRDQLHVPDGLDQDTLADVRKDLLDLNMPKPGDDEATPDGPEVLPEVPMVPEVPAMPAEDAEAQDAAPKDEHQALADTGPQILKRLSSLEQKVDNLDTAQKSLEDRLDKVPSSTVQDGPGTSPPGTDEGYSEAQQVLEKISSLEKQVEGLASRVPKEVEVATIVDNELTPDVGDTGDAGDAGDAANARDAEETTKGKPTRGAEDSEADTLRKLQEEVRQLSAAVDTLRQAESKKKSAPSSAAAESSKVEAEGSQTESLALDDLKQKVKTLTEALSALEDSQGGLADEVKSLAEALEKNQVSALADVQSLRRLVEEGETPKVTRLVEEVEALRRNVEEGEPAQKVQSLDSSVKDLQEIQQDLKTKVESIGSREAEISDLQQQVKGLGDTVGKTAEMLQRNESLSEVSKLKDALDAVKRRQEEFNLQIEATQRKQLNAIREDLRVVQASQEASAKRQAQIKEGTQSLEKEQLQLASKLRQLEGGRIKQLGQDMQVVKEAILHVQQELKKEVVIPEHVLKDLDAKNESRLEAVWTELQRHAEAAATRADRLEQSLTQRVVHLEQATTILVKAEEHTRNLEQDMQKQSEWFAWRIAWLEWATTGEKRSFARALLPPPSTPAATCFKQPLTEDSELWAQEKTGRQRLRRAPLNNMPNVGAANERSLAVSSPSMSISSSAPDLQISPARGQSATRLPEIR